MTLSKFVDSSFPHCNVHTGVQGGCLAFTPFDGYLKLWEFPQNKWFDEECKIAKRNVNDYPQKHNIDISLHRKWLKDLHTEYQRVKQLKECTYEQNLSDKLVNMLTKNPNANWKLWDSLSPANINRSELTIKNLDNYIKSHVKSPSTWLFWPWPHERNREFCANIF